MDGGPEMRGGFLFRSLLRCPSTRIEGTITPPGGLGKFLGKNVHVNFTVSPIENTGIMTDCIALVVAAGRGRRFGGDLPKQYRTLGGVPILRRTLMGFVNHRDVNQVRTVIHPDDRSLFEEASAGLDVLEAVDGGLERQDSVRLGLESLASFSPAKVLIHDAARPFAGAALISDVIKALGDHDSAVPAVPVSDTLKRSDGGLVTGTVSRDGLWRAQTPQGFRYGEILAAHQDLAGHQLTDDAAVAEEAGLSVALVEGSEENIKITTEDDLKRAVSFLSAGEIRTGFGYDVHRFGPGDAVTLCGVAIPHSSGLEGHSDADVALHAVTDALLGAIGAGDIGSHFPPSDDKWRGAASDIFLRHAQDLLATRSGSICNVDLTIVCEQPKIGPHRPAMVETTAAILGLAPDRVSVKATTTERLGFTGREEGIAAQAVVTVRLAPQD